MEESEISSTKKTLSKFILYENGKLEGNKVKAFGDFFSIQKAKILYKNDDVTPTPTTVTNILDLIFKGKLSNDIAQLLHDLFWLALSSDFEQLTLDDLLNILNIAGIKYSVVTVVLISAHATFTAEPNDVVNALLYKSIELEYKKCTGRSEGLSMFLKNDCPASHLIKIQISKDNSTLKFIKQTPKEIIETLKRLKLEKHIKSTTAKVDQSETTQYEFTENVQQEINKLIASFIKQFFSIELFPALLKKILQSIYHVIPDTQNRFSLIGGVLSLVIIGPIIDNLLAKPENSDFKALFSALVTAPLHNVLVSLGKETKSARETEERTKSALGDLKANVCIATKEHEPIVLTFMETLCKEKFTPPEFPQVSMLELEKTCEITRLLSGTKSLSDYETTQTPTPTRPDRTHTQAPTSTTTTLECSKSDEHKKDEKDKHSKFTRAFSWKRNKKEKKEKENATSARSSRR